MQDNKNLSWQISSKLAVTTKWTIAGSNNLQTNPSLSWNCWLREALFFLGKRLTRLSHVWEAWSSNLGPINSYTTFQMVRHLFNINKSRWSSCVA